MLNKVTIGRYYPICSKVHMMNPIAKILCLILFVLAVFVANNIFLLTIILILLILMLLDSKIPLKTYVDTVLSIKWFLLFIIITNYLLKVNIFDNLIIVFRLTAMILYTSILTLTTPVNEITYGLERVFSPLKLFKIPVNKMALSISLALRFIPNLIDEGNKILKSQASRGIDYYNSNFKTKVMALRTLIIPVFILTIKRADDLADSMEVRLYNISSKRINFRQNKWGFYDTFLFTLHLSLFILVVKEVLL